MNLSSLSGRFDPRLYMMQMGQFMPQGQPPLPYDIGGMGKPVNPNDWMPPPAQPAIDAVRPPPVPGSYPMGPGTPEPAMPAAGGMDPKMMMAMQMLQGMGGQQQAPAMQPPPPVKPQPPGPTVPVQSGNPEPMQRALQALMRLQEARRNGGGQQQRGMPPGMFGM